jgi:hypothetical protein
LDHLLGAIGRGNRKLPAENQCRRRGAVASHFDNGDAAADAGNGRWRSNFDVARLAQLSADEAEHANRGVDRQLATAGRGVEHELVDGQFRVRADAERGPVEKEQLRLAARVGGDALLEDDIVADRQGSLVAIRLDAGGGRVDGPGDADAHQIGRRWRYPGRAGQRKRG